MKRTQIYLAPDQYEFLENLAFLESKKEHKRVSISEIIRNAISIFKESYIRNKSEDKDLLKRLKTIQAVIDASDLYQEIEFALRISWFSFL